MQLIFRTPGYVLMMGGINSYDALGYIKRMLSRIIGYPLDQFRLVHEGIILHDENIAIASHFIQDGDTLSMILFTQPDHNTIFPSDSTLFSNTWHAAAA